MTEVGRLSLEAQRLWQAVLDTAVHRPAPMSAFDAFFQLALIVTLRGTQAVVYYYRMLLDEMKERIATGIGAVPRERYRLLWDNIPVWYRMKWLSEKFASHGACLVADTYTSAWCGTLKYIDEKDFLSTMAEGYSRIYLVQHFFLDVYVGAVIGVFSALFSFWMINANPLFSILNRGGLDGNLMGSNLLKVFTKRF